MKTQDPDSQELLRRAAQGDRNACGALLAHYQARLQRMIELRMDRRLVARLEAADVVQNTLAQALQQLPAYLRERPLPFYPWLRQIAWERLLQLSRRHIHAQKRSVTREERFLSPALRDESAVELIERLLARGSSPSSRLGRAELHAQVRAALAQLADTDREVLVLRHLEQLSLAEIAAILGISEGTAGKRHLCALERLRAMLGNLPGEQEP